MNVVIKPTVGRIVWFTPPSDTDANMHIIDRKQPLAAIVAFVQDDQTVNLTVSDHAGLVWSWTNVPLIQDGEDFPEGGVYAQWMPYQKGQAKTHEVSKDS